jgi:hypothetical protein
MKTPFNCGYMNNPPGATFANAGCFALANGQPFFDVAGLFAANINGDSPDDAQLSFNEQMAFTLGNTDTVKTLQSQGITVLLTILGNHQNAGWSNFTTYSGAMVFAQQLATCVAKYGLDGIDIDDEYSTGTPNDTSLIMATSALRSLLPAGKLITKALFDDSNYFAATWNGMTLAQQLSYGWQMAYGSGGTERLEPYLGWGMTKGQLALGVQPGESDAGSLAAQVLAQGYGGMMMYTADNDDTETVGTVDAIAEAFYDQSASVTPGCWTTSSTDGT